MQKQIDFNLFLHYFLKYCFIIRNDVNTVKIDNDSIVLFNNEKNVLYKKFYDLNNIKILNFNKDLTFKYRFFYFFKNIKTDQLNSLLYNYLINKYNLDIKDGSNESNFLLNLKDLDLNVRTNIVITRKNVFLSFKKLYEFNDKKINKHKIKLRSDVNFFNVKNLIKNKKIYIKEIKDFKDLISLI